MRKFSVCIPTYNRAAYIGETIASVLASAYPNLEIIVSDNASTDNTREIIDDFGDDRIHFYRNTSNLGPVKNWNCALEKASGEFIGVLYSDDLYGPFWLTFAAHVLEKHPHIGWVTTAFRVIDRMGQTLKAVSRFAETGEVDRDEAFICIAKLDGLGPAYVARREALDGIGYYDEDVGPAADTDLYLRLASRYPLYYSANPHHAAYRRHADNLTHQLMDSIGLVPEKLRILNKIFGDHTLPEELRQHKRHIYINLYKKVLARSLKLLREGEIEVVQHIVHLLHTNGYR